MVKQYILLLDDEPDFVDSIEQLLKVMGYYNILTATDPRDALKLVKDKNITVIVSDHKMPPMNGIEFFRKINTFGLDRTVYKIIYTGYSELEEDMDDMMREMIINEFVLKSTSPEVFLMSIKNGFKYIENFAH